MIGRVSQTDRVLEMLRERQGGWLCSSAFYAAQLPHARNRIAEELKPKGFVIETRPCHSPEHPASARYVEYRIALDPEIEQPELIAI